MITATPAGVRANDVRVENPGNLQTASLTFDNGLEHFRISVGNNSDDTLVEASLADPVPVVCAQHDRISIEYPLGSRLLRRMEESRVRLDAHVTWSLDVHSGAAHSTIDLSSGHLSSAVFHGGLADTVLVLPQPVGECLIRLQSVQRVRIVRPSGVHVRLELEQGATNVEFDHRSYGSAREDPSDQSDGFAQSGDHYVITARSGVSELKVGTS
jgi:hypothetical protein